jgi:hypothetical protein
MPKPANWKNEPDEHDYPAAASYLSLVVPGEDVDRLVAALKAAPLTTRKAKDLLRASALPVLGTDNFHVAADLEKVKNGGKLSPVLVVRGDLRHPVRPLTIADGYHRICASYHMDEDEDIPCKLAAFE